MNLPRYLKEVKSSRALKRLSPEVQVAVEAVIEAAIAIENSSGRSKAKTGEGPRSIVTYADKKAQKVIFERLLGRFPHAKILGEEKTSHPAALSSKNPVGILGQGLYYVVDPVDGTTPFSHKQGDWSIGIGVIHNGVFLGGVVFAPHMNGGLLVFAERNKGAFFKEGASLVRRIPAKRPMTTPKDSIAKIGVDSMLYPNLQAMEVEIAANVQGFYIAGSGLLALANVAIGRIGLVIQPPQKPWDWTQTLAMLKETGKTIWFFRLKNGKVVPMSWIDERALTLPRETNGFGFIAGEKTLVKKAVRILPRTNWKMIDPDTARGTW